MTSLRTTRRDAARRLLDGAIKAYLEGSWEVSIVLASAAEGVTPSGTDKPLHKRIRDKLREGFGSETEAWDPNDIANWLKHAGDGKLKGLPYPDKCEIPEIEVISYILRVSSKFSECYDERISLPKAIYEKLTS